MHLPDGTINNQASVTFIAVSGVFAFWALKQVKSQLFEKVKSLVPQLAAEFGILTAPKVFSLKIRPKAKQLLFDSALVFSLIYLAQLYDFPIINGVYGHLIGAALAGIVLGPALGLLVISSVLLIQAVFFGDGGILALGANIFNMAVVGSAGGWLIYQSLKKILPINPSIFFAVLFSALGSALAFGLVMFVSHQIIISQLLSEILLPHFFIGLIEGVLSLLAIKCLFSNYVFNDAAEN